MLSIAILLLFWDSFFTSYSYSSTSFSYLPCLHSEDGRHYTGEINLTTSGRNCLPWNITGTKYSLRELRINDYKKNFCRNPDGSRSLWCFVSVNKDGMTEREDCKVDMCPLNPDSYHCLLIPSFHFERCPFRFMESSASSDLGIKDMILCCVKNDSWIMDLLPKNSCLIVVVKTNLLKEHYSVCPRGYHSQSLRKNELESNVMYQCCKGTDVPKDFVDRLKLLLRTEDVRGPVLAFISSKDVLCPLLPGLIPILDHYHGLDRFSKEILPGVMTICTYFKNVTRLELGYGQLGFLTLKECPPRFSLSRYNLSIFVYDSSRFRYCWSKSMVNIIPKKTLCLNVDPMIQGSVFCPQDFLTFNMLSPSTKDPLAKLCCKSSKSIVDTFTSTLDISENTSVAFFTPDKKCRLFQRNPSVKSYMLQVTMEKNDFDKTVREIPKTSHSFPFCVYELRKDEFAYKKVGPTCPEGMFFSKVLFKESSPKKEVLFPKTFVEEFCVGNGHFGSGSFPKGRYCIYKMRSPCVPGFFPVQRSQRRSVISQRNVVPDYNGAPFCCRNDSATNGSVSSGSFPFIRSNGSSSFGILVPNHFDLCPNVSGFVGYNDFDPDGPFCSFRTEINNYRWIHQTLRPELTELVVDRDRFDNITIIRPWKKLRAWTYFSSILHMYPKGEFCILSSDVCSSIKGINYIVKYPVKDFFLCCRLGAHFSPVDSSHLWMNLSDQYSIGFVAIHGKCPHMDQNMFLLRSIVYDTFQIKAEQFENEYRMNLLKVGIIPDGSSLKNSVNVDFQFCNYVYHKGFKDEDSSFSFGFGSFIKPIHSFCPNRYQEMMRNVSLDMDLETDPVSQYFIKERSSLSVCSPLHDPANIHKTQWPSSLCPILNKDCSDSIELFGPTLKICCFSAEHLLDPGSSFPPQFSLPLNPRHSRCPSLRGFSSLIWRLPLSRPSISFCFFFVSFPPSPWPPGSFLTLPYQGQCPPDFHLSTLGGSSLCLRTDSSHSLDPRFPGGNYCLLTALDEPCPPRMSWGSKIDPMGLGSTTLNLCCSASQEMMLNIRPSSKGTSFSFLSVRRCSFVPGMKVKKVDFLLFRKVVQCVYSPEEDCSKRGLGRVCPREPGEMEVVSITRQNLIIGLLVSVLATILLLGGILVLYHRMKRVRPHYDMQTSTMKLSAIYTQIDLLMNYDEPGGGGDCIDEEETPSVVYSDIL